MKRQTLFLAGAVSLWLSSAAAQPRRETVLLHCGSYHKLAQSSDNAPPVDRYANCTEELRRALDEGYVLFSVESGDAPAPFFTLLEPESRQPQRSSGAGAAATILYCDWNHNYDGYRVVSSSASARAPAVASGEGVLCANALAQTMGAGLSLARVHVAKDASDGAYLLLIRASATRARHRKGRRGGTHTALLSCRPGTSWFDEIGVEHVASSDSFLSLEPLMEATCGDALVALIERGYRLADFQSGERGSVMTMTLIASN